LVHEHADRVDDSARPQNAKQTGGEVDGVGHLEGNHVTLADASRREGSSDGLGEFFKLAVGGRRSSGEFGDGGECCLFFVEVNENEVEHVVMGAVQSETCGGVE